MIRILHWRGKCIGCNACAEIFPTRWRVSKKDGKSTLIGAENKKGIYQLLTSELEKDRHIMAAKNCPVNIIKVMEAGK